MNYNAKESWAKQFSQMDMSYPAEYVIRIFKGKYPKLNLTNEDFVGKKICDSGFGDGRHLHFFHRLGFEVSGYEIDQRIVKQVSENLSSFGISPELRVGLNRDIPFEGETFDYFLSWNSSYYMGDKLNYGAHLQEFARVIKPGGKFVISVPTKDSFIFKGAKPISEGYVEITNDPFNCRNGEIMRCFEDFDDFLGELSPFFKNIKQGTINDDCFGHGYSWFLVVCERK